MATGTQLALIMNGAGKVQVNKDTPLDISDLDTRINITSRNWINEEKTIDDILDCNQEEIVFREVRRIIRRLPIEGEFVPVVCAPLAAYNFGQAGGFTGTTANFVKTFTVTHTDGYWNVELDFDGIVSKSANIPYDASADRFRYILGQMDNIGQGNLIVTVNTATPGTRIYTVTATGKLSGANIPNAAFTIDDAGANGGDVVLAQTTAGSQKSATITESLSREMALTTFGLAFADEPGSERLLVGSAVDNFRVTGATADGRVTFAADIIARDKITADGLIIPECVVSRPIRTTDCILQKAGVDITENIKGFQISNANNMLTGDSAFTSRGTRITRLLRAIRRTRNLTFGLLGGVTTPIYEEAEINPDANIKSAYSLRIGTAGNNLTWNYPNGLPELATGGGLDFDGESEESIERFTVTPTKVGSTPPQNIVANVPGTGVYLDD